MTLKSKLFLVAMLLVSVAGTANAVPIIYSMTGNGFYDNPIGSFTYDASTNTYSDVSIWSLDYYGSARSSSTASSFRSTGALGTTLRLNFSDPLTDAGGAISFTGYEQGLLTFFGRVARSGMVDGSSASAARSGGSVPAPDAALLLGLGLIGLWLAPRRKAASRRN